jgi:hypothetical protein
MPKLNVKVEHDLGADAARQRLQSYLEKVKERHGDKFKDLEENMEGNRGTFSFKTMGFKVAGGVDVGDKDVSVDLDLPFAAMLFKGKIETELRSQLAQLLGQGGESLEPPV